MSRYSRKIDRAAAERLLRGEQADPRHPNDLLAVLLATVAAPAHVGELAGEEAAVAAFRQARAADAARAARSIDEPSATPRRPREAAPARSWVRHPLRLALVAVTATTAGGTALAAGSITWSQGPADRRPATASATPPRPAGGPGSGHGRHGSPAATSHPVIGLCRAYTAGAGSAPGKALENPAFRSLIEAAGGKEKVAGYCATVLASAEAKRAKKTKRHVKTTTPPAQSGQEGQSGRSGQQPESDQSGRQGATDGSAGPDQSGRQDQTNQAGSGGSGEPTAYPTPSATPVDSPSEEAVPQRTRAP